MTLATADFYSITLTFFPNTNFEYLFVNGANPLKEVLNPAWSCTNGNAQYTNRILSLGSNDTTICLNWGSCNTCLMPVVPTNNAVTNVTIGEEESGCYDATETITVAGNGTTFKVLAAGSATMVAGQKITILPGAEVLSGGYFHGYITTTGDYCSVAAVPVTKSAVSEGVSLIEAGELTLKLFPNPASSNVTLDLQGAENCVQTKYEMIGMRGETLRTGNFTGNGKYPISLSGISGGVYYVRIICGDQVVTKMLIKNE
jgi:hypothetical protein